MCWICPICSTSNEDTTRICFVCGHERKRKRVPIEEIESSYEQGCAYYRNESYESAFELLNFAAEHRYVPALIKIAECYRLGRGTAISVYLRSFFILNCCLVIIRFVRGEKYFERVL